MNMKRRSFLTASLGGLGLAVTPAKAANALPVDFGSADSLSKKQKCIAIAHIAEACGWVRCSGPHGPGNVMSWEKITNGQRSYLSLLEDIWCFSFHGENVPDYFTDLNAISKAEAFLTEDQWAEYSDIIFSLTRKRASVTAAQRAEAFLRCIGKWGAAL